MWGPNTARGTARKRGRRGRTQRAHHARPLHPAPPDHRIPPEAQCAGHTRIARRHHRQPDRDAKPRGDGGQLWTPPTVRDVRMRWPHLRWLASKTLTLFS